MGIMFLSTPQNVTDLELLLEIGVPALKVGSDDLTNGPLIERYARTGLPLILSCGMADLAEVHQALEAAGHFDGHPVVLLLCTSQYPTPAGDVNLNKLRTLAAAFPGVVPGFSDHTQGAVAAAAAVGLGAVVFEKHFTLDHDLPGPDHWFSEDPPGLTAWVAAIRGADAMMGTGIVRPTDAERVMRRMARRSVTALRDIAPGELLTDENTGLRRPGTGLAPSQLGLVVGRHSAVAVPKGKLLAMEDIA
jgi:N,N'-diacetyllegionaminate synthase